MDNTMLDFSDTAITQDQTMALQSKIIEFVREALIYNKGYVIFEVLDLDDFTFNFYYSEGSSIAAKYDETREETIERILFTIDCKELKRREYTGERINNIIRYLYNYVVGQVSANIMYEKYGIRDVSLIFKDESDSKL